MIETLFDDPALGIYQREQYIPFRDCDCLGRVSLCTWLSWMAELAGDQYEQRNLGRDELLKNQQVFLLSRISLRVLRHPISYETLTATTWEKGIDTVFFRRNYDFAGADGVVCAEGSSLWLLCDPYRHRILRPSALQHPVQDVDRAISCPFPDKIVPPEDMTELGKRPVFFSDLDANEHVYCANYGRIFADWLPAAYQRKPFTDFTLNYIKEAKLGESLTLAGHEETDRYLMTGTHADGSLCFTAQMMFEPERSV